MTKEKDISKMETTTLTEQWQQGKLKDGFYFVKEGNEIFISICSNHYLLNVLNDCEVLAPIPTYEEWEELQESNDGLSKLMFKSLMNKFVKADEERERLEKENSELTTKCSQLEKKVKKRGMQINRAYDRYVAKRKENSEFVQKIHILNEANINLENIIGKFGEQLKEANEVIKFYSDAHQLSEEEKQMMGEKYHLVYGLKAIDYLEKWGVK